jgi:hypothetical protein
MDARDLLNEYSDNLIGIENLNNNKMDLIDEILTPEIKEKLAEIDAEFEPKIDALNARNQALIDTVKGEVLTVGQSISGDYHVVKFVKGRVTWDTVRLEGYAAAHPEILQFRTDGEPYTVLSKRTPMTKTIGKAKRNQWSSIRLGER